MKSSDRTILIGIAVIAVIAGFWLMVLGPKRKEASELSSQVETLQAQVAQDEQAASAGLQAQTGFSHNYRRLVALGKAVPADADTPSLLTEVQSLSKRSKVSFRSMTLAPGEGSGAAPVATSSADPAAASEAAAALLPIGATVSLAGLPVMPYSLEFQGGFFEVADFFGELDSTVRTEKNSKVRVDGRLLTIDGFSLQAAQSGFPDLSATVSVTSYLAPQDQGITAGASPTGPPTGGTVPATDPAAAPTTPPATTATVGAN